MKSFARLIVPCCVSMLFIGCLAKENNHETRIDLDGNVESFNECLGLFEEKIRFPRGENHSIYRWFKLDRRHSNQSIILDVGLYALSARERIISESFLKGDYNAALNVLNGRGITCKWKGGFDSGKVSFSFPRSDNSDYNKVDISCGSDCKEAKIQFGQLNKSSGKLAITTKHSMRDGRIMFHAFDTDREGRIVSHRLSKGGGPEGTWEEVWREN